MPPGDDRALREAASRIPKSPADLAAELLPGGLEGYSALQGPPWLLVDLTGPPAAPEELAALRDGLARLPCPSIGVGGGKAAEGIAASLDVLLDPHAVPDGLLDNIERHPLAAAVLVQLLRHNERSSIADGLIAESLAYGTLQAGADHRRFLSSRPSPVLNQDAEPVLLSREGNELAITLNRPAHNNAYSAGMRDGLHEALQVLASDPSLTRAVLRGAGRCFCTGGDLSEFGLAGDPAQAHCVRMARPVGLLLAQLADRVECRVHGACIGSGIELPAFAGRLVAAPDTYFHLPELALGLIPGAGGTVSIPRRIGRQRAGYLMLSGRRIDARTARAWGLIDAIE